MYIVNQFLCTKTISKNEIWKMYWSYKYPISPWIFCQY